MNSFFYRMYLTTINTLMTICKQFYKYLIIWAYCYRYIVQSKNVQHSVNLMCVEIYKYNVAAYKDPYLMVVVTDHAKQYTRGMERVIKFSR